MTEERVTLFDAVQWFLGPLMAEYARLIEEGDPESTVTIMFCDREYKTTLKDIQRLDRAHQQAFDAKVARNAKKAVGTLI